MTNSETTAPKAAVYDPIAYNAWVDSQRQPGDPEGAAGAAAALARRVKQHLFVASGGVVIKTQGGMVTYGEPVIPTTTPVCPWHGEGCSAWEFIAKADEETIDSFSFDGPTLRELRSMTPAEIAEARKMDEIERIAHNYGNISRKIAKSVSDSEDRFQEAWAAGHIMRRYPSREEKARDRANDDAARDLADAASDLGDEIVIEGDEGDEDEPEVSGNIDQEGK